MVTAANLLKSPLPDFPGVWGATTPKERERIRYHRRHGEES